PCLRGHERLEAVVGGRSGGERVACGGSGEGHAGAGKAGAANVGALGSRLARAVTIRRLLVTCWRSGKSAAPALPAAARHWPCAPGGTLAVRPDPRRSLGSA